MASLFTSHYCIPANPRTGYHHCTVQPAVQLREQTHPDRIKRGCINLSVRKGGRRQPLIDKPPAPRDQFVEGTFVPWMHCSAVHTGWGLSQRCDILLIKYWFWDILSECSLNAFQCSAHWLRVHTKVVLLGFFDQKVQYNRTNESSVVLTLAECRVAAMW